MAIEVFVCENFSVSVKHQQLKKEKIMPPQLVQLVQSLQTLTSQIANIVLNNGGSPGNPNPSSAPQNVQAAYAALNTACATLATDIAATPFVSATVEADVVTLQQAVAALQTALANPSNP